MDLRVHYMCDVIKQNESELEKKVLYFARYLISQGGEICENKSLAKIDNPNTLVNKNIRYGHWRF